MLTIVIKWWCKICILSPTGLLRITWSGSLSNSNHNDFRLFKASLWDLYHGSSASRVWQTRSSRKGDSFPVQKKGKSQQQFFSSLNLFDYDPPRFPASSHTQNKLMNCAAHLQSNIFLVSFCCHSLQMSRNIKCFSENLMQFFPPQMKPG